jgi:hypothetical protein
MNAKPLSQTNPYLRDPKQRAEMTRTHVISSSAIEDVHITYSHKKADFVLKKSDKPTSHNS